jgi:predicted secreted protein
MNARPALAALLLLAACGRSADAPQPHNNNQAEREPDDRLRDVQNGGLVELRRGQTFSFTLGSNDTTGYSWSIVEQPPFLQSAGGSYIGPDPGPDGEIAAGAGGSRLYRFRADGAGEGTLRLEYRGPGSQEELAGSFELHIRAR